MGIFGAMDFQFWIWLIVIVITLIARANKKKPGQPPVEDDYPDQGGPPTSRTPPKAISFEDLLREIQGEKAMSRPEPKPVAQKPVKEYDFVDYDDDIPDEIEDLEDVDYNVKDDDRAFQAYEAAKREAAKGSQAAERSKVGDLVRMDHFRGYDQRKKRKPTFNFLKELKDPQGFKKAFIMSEILNRKY